VAALSGGALREETLKCLYIFATKEKEKFVAGPDGGLIPRQTGRLTIVRKIILTLNEQSDQITKMMLLMLQ
jgi:hypothetical protein